MPFSNLAIDHASLPRAGELELQAPPTAFRRLLHLEWRLTALFFFACAGALFYFLPSWRSHAAYVATGAALVLLLAPWYLSIELGWRWRGYAVRTHDVAYRSGWIFRRLQVCPFSRVQNCSLSRGPLERRYGLASLRLFTAGSDGADLRLPGLPLQEAESLQQFFLQYLHGTDNTADRLV